MSDPVSGKKQRIAIIGGGVGGIATAFSLTSKPKAAEELEVDLYQLGWRIGGKGASGRNAGMHQRIEEHGLHIWMGFYFNAFRMMDAAYQELNRPAGAPLRTTWDAFKPHDFVVWEEFIDKQWVNWPIDFPKYSRKPTEGEGFPSPLGILIEAVERALGIWSDTENVSVTRARKSGKVRVPAHPIGLLEKARECVLSVMGAVTGEVESFAWNRLRHEIERLKVNHEDPREDLLSDLREALGSFLRWLHEEIDEEALSLDDDLHRIVVTVELALVTSTGMLVDGVLLKGFDCIDEYDFVEWLKRHGGSDLLVDSAPIRAIYDLLFSFKNGDTSSLENRNMAAGVALRGCFRMTICYYGSIFWKMQAGMGDTVFAPFYEVLRKRGVRFHFFHNVKNLGLSDDGKRIERIDIDVQASVKNGSEYHPLVDVEGLPCWPSEPLYDQLVEGDEIREKDIDLECFWSPWQAVAKKRLVEGRDFDSVVLAVPPSCFDSMCPELLVADRRFQACADKVTTVQTQAAQFWLDTDLTGLGWNLASPVMTSYVEPLDTWADMTHLLMREAWPTSELPRSLAYFCGPLRSTGDIPPPNDHEFPKREFERAKNTAVEFLEKDALRLWPNAHEKTDQKAFNFDLLHDAEERCGHERLNAQYFRANVSPTERYVLSEKKSISSRLSSNEVYFENLYVTGDWTRNGLNAGCVESAVMSGMQCSRAICGFPEVVIGEGDFPGASNKQTPTNQYIWRENDPSLAGPVVNLGARLTSFILKGQRECLQRTLDESINRPNLGQDRYVALSDFFVLTQARLPHSYFNMPQYRALGWASETDWLIMIPTLVVTMREGRYYASRLGAFVYGCLVDQPYALTTGREVFGFPKTLGIFTEDETIKSASTWVLPTFAPSTELALMKVIEVTQTNSHNGSLQSLKDGIQLVLKSMSVHKDGSFYFPDGDFWLNSLEDSLLTEFPLFLLKQTRTCAANQQSVYQAVLECETRVTRFVSGGIVPPGATVEFTSYASQPFSQDLGLPTGPTNPLLTLEFELDFTIEEAVRIWDRAEKQ